MNLDVIINKIGYDIVQAIEGKGRDKKKYKNKIDKVLGVLANDGVYAFWVYCKAEKITDVFVGKLGELKKIVDPISDEKRDENFFMDLSSSELTNLLFFKEMLEKVLTYAKYHEKALDDDLDGN